jgi:hypothetical protein
MPGRWLHRKFDRYLRDHGFISMSGCAAVADRVHAAMDRGVHDYGASHRDRDPHHDPEYIRSIVHEIASDPGHRADAVTIACGHVVLDRMGRAFPEADDVHLVWIAFDTFVRLGYDRDWSAA